MFKVQLWALSSDLGQCRIPHLQQCLYHLPHSCSSHLCKGPAQFGAAGGQHGSTVLRGVQARHPRGVEERHVCDPLQPEVQHQAGGERAHAGHSRFEP